MEAKHPNYGEDQNQTGHSIEWQNHGLPGIVAIFRISGFGLVSAFGDSAFGLPEGAAPIKRVC
jgi:hypothetical protein